MSINNGLGLNGPLGSAFPPGFAREYPNYAGFVNYVDSSFGGQVQWNWQLFDSLYRTSWIAQKICNVLADDITDKWREFIHEDPEVVKKRQAYEEENQIADKYRQAILAKDLYGGSALIPIIQGQFNDEHFQKEFNPQSVKKNQLRGFQILNRFDFAPLTGINRDIYQNPNVFGDFIYYKIIRIQTMMAHNKSGITDEPVNSMNLPTIHVSRMIKFYGTELLYYQKFFSGGWGDSILVPLIDKIPAIEEAFHLVFLYLDLFNIDEVKIPNLSAIVNSGGGAQLFSKYTRFRDMMRNSKLRFMDANDTMNRNQITSLQNIVPVFEELMHFVISSTGIPITRILGTTLSGLNATGDNELTQYYDLILQKQKKLSYQLRITDEIIERSLFGKKMDIQYRWISKREVNEKERAEINALKAQTFSSYMQNRVMTPKVVAQNIQKDFSGIDDNYILTLDEDFIDFEGSEDDQNAYEKGDSEEGNDSGEFEQHGEKDEPESTKEARKEEDEALSEEKAEGSDLESSRDNE